MSIFLVVGLLRRIGIAFGAACLVSLPARVYGRDGDAVETALPVIPDTTSAPVQVPPVVAGQHATGSFYVGYRGSDGQTTGGVATLSPGWGAFVRVGAEVTPRSPDGAFRFLWGLGLEDARDRTFFLHVHDWGPVRPGRFTLRTAEASVGYKLPRACGGGLCLAPSVLATLPFAGGPWVGARTALTVGRTWFLAAAFGWTVPGVLPGTANAEPWLASIALGRWDWRPGGLFVTYRDELTPQQVRVRSRFFREGQGLLALGVNWEY